MVKITPLCINVLDHAHSVKISSSISPGHSVPEYTAIELTCQADANPLPSLNLFYTDGQRSWQLSPEWVVDTAFTLRFELS